MTTAAVCKAANELPAKRAHNRREREMQLLETVSSGKIKWPKSASERHEEIFGELLRRYVTKVEKSKPALPEMPKEVTSKNVGGRKPVKGDPDRAPKRLLSHFVTAYQMSEVGYTHEEIGHKVGLSRNRVGAAVRSVRHYIAKHGEGSELEFLGEKGKSRIKRSGQPTHKTPITIETKSGMTQ